MSEAIAHRIWTLLLGVFRASTVVIKDMIVKITL